MALLRGGIPTSLHWGPCIARQSLSFGHFSITSLKRNTNDATPCVWPTRSHALCPQVETHDTLWHASRCITPRPNAFLHDASVPSAPRPGTRVLIPPLQLARSGNLCPHRANSTHAPRGVCPATRSPRPSIELPGDVHTGLALIPRALSSAKGCSPHSVRAGTARSAGANGCLCLASHPTRARASMAGISRVARVPWAALSAPFGRQWLPWLLLLPRLRTDCSG